MPAAWLAQVNARLQHQQALAIVHAVSEYQEIIARVDQEQRELVQALSQVRLGQAGTGNCRLAGMGTCIWAKQVSQPGQNVKPICISILKCTLLCPTMHVQDLAP